MEYCAGIYFNVLLCLFGLVECEMQEFLLLRGGVHSHVRRTDGHCVCVRVQEANIQFGRTSELVARTVHDTLHDTECVCLPFYSIFYSHREF